MGEGDFRSLNKILIIGLGLMGGSFAKALKDRGFDGKIYGMDLNERALDLAMELEIIDGHLAPHSNKVRDIDLVVLATPIRKYKDVIEAMSQNLNSNVMVSDLGSVKNIYEDLKGVLPEGVRFIGGHPMAGSEKSGVENADGNLFDGRCFFITPYEDERGIKSLEKLIELTGAKVQRVCPKTHDKMTALTSHLPHLSAAILVDLLEDFNPNASSKFVGKGFKDSTRIASGAPEVWKDIFVSNKEMVQTIECFQKRLEDFKRAIELEDEAFLIEKLSRIKISRDQMIEK
jgi:prephenate dehydrogenase